MDCRFQEAMEDLCASINDGCIIDTKTLDHAKRDVARRYGLSKIPSNTEIMAVLGRTLDYLQRKPMRTLSGVAIIAVMSRPAPCPHGDRKSVV